MNIFAAFLISAFMKKRPKTPPNLTSVNLIKIRNQ